MWMHGCMDVWMSFCLFVPGQVTRTRDTSSGVAYLLWLKLVNSLFIATVLSR